MLKYEVLMHTDTLTITENILVIAYTLSLGHLCIYRAPLYSIYCIYSACMAFCQMYCIVLYCTVSLFVSDI